MEWYIALLIIYGALLILMATGMPVAAAFLIVITGGAYLFLGGSIGLEQVIIQTYANLATYALFPLPLFIFMGELLLHSGITPRILDTVDMWLGKMPGRLAVMSVAGGTILSVLSGASVATVAMLGKALIPEMERRNYSRSMTLGPILGSGGLAIMIPPSGLAILLGSIGQISIGKLLIAIIVPGLFMAFFYFAYIIGACMLKPEIAPPYNVQNVKWTKKIFVTIRDLIPVGFVVFMVTGIIFFGIATPSEAAATGVIGVFILLIFYGKFSLQPVKQAVKGTLKTTGMLFLIIAGANTFSSILGYTGALSGFITFATELEVAPILIVIFMILFVLILGSFMPQASIMMITLPIFIPVIVALGFNEVWFGVLFLVNTEMSLTTPPFGLNLFVMKGIASADTKSSEIYKSAVPYLICDSFVMILLMVFPAMALWLPSVMH